MVLGTEAASCRSGQCPEPLSLTPLRHHSHQCGPSTQRLALGFPLCSQSCATTSTMNFRVFVCRCALAVTPTRRPGPRGSLLDTACLPGLSPLALGCAVTRGPPQRGTRVPSHWSHFVGCRGLSPFVGLLRHSGTEPVVTQERLGFCLRFPVLSPARYASLKGVRVPRCGCPGAAQQLETARGGGAHTTGGGQRCTPGSPHPVSMSVCPSVSPGEPAVKPSPARRRWGCLPCPGSCLKSFWQEAGVPERPFLAPGDEGPHQGPGLALRPPWARSKQAGPGLLPLSPWAHCCPWRRPNLAWALILKPLPQPALLRRLSA